MYKKFDLIFGFCVIGIFIWFLFQIINFSLYSKSSFYYIETEFSSAGGVKVGSEVKISGIAIGEIDKISLDETTFAANILLKINSKYKIPIDSSASIQSQSLLGEKHIEIYPGIEDKSLSNNSKILATQSAISLEKLLNFFISNKSQ